MAQKKDKLIKPIIWDTHFRKFYNKLYWRKSRMQAKHRIKKDY